MFGKREMNVIVAELPENRVLFIVLYKFTCLNNYHTQTSTHTHTRDYHKYMQFVGPTPKKNNNFHSSLKIKG